MTRHIYPLSALVGDYLRAIAGFIPPIAVLVIAPVGAVGAVVLGGFAALFAVFGIRTALRHCVSIEMNDAALMVSGLPRALIPWNKLDRMKLSYYSTRRDGRGGWMQLELRAGSSILRVDSRIEGFSELVRASAAAAETRGLLIDLATLANLEALRVERWTAAASHQGRAAGGAE
jgi:hypothetical protein